MRFRSGLLVYLLALTLGGGLLPGAALAQRPNPAGKDPVERIILRAIELFTNEHIKEALGLFQKVIDRNRDDPKGYFYKAAAYSVIMQDYRTRAFEQEFFRHIELAIAKAQDRLEKNNNDAEAHFYLGGAYGYRGIDKTLVGSWLGAFLDATRGIFHLQKALAFNPNYYDAYYGLGAYHYWVSAKSSILWFLPFFSDERARGIEELRLASRRGRFARYEAKAALVTVLMNEGRWQEALKEVDELLERFPQDLSSHIQRGRILAALGRWAEVEREFTWVKEFLKRAPYVGYMRKLEAHYHLALAAHRQRRFKLFFKRCLQVQTLMGRNRFQPYIEGLKEVEAQARQLCGPPIEPTQGP
jgi:tetratricopeptide (TPR) repeat protein